MGTDIRIQVERRTIAGWELVENPIREACIYCNGTRTFRPGMGCVCGPDGRRPARWWRDRNYGVFAALANVRNDEEPKVRPIAPCRGFPLDGSDALMSLSSSEPDDLGEDSHTWLTCAEILAYDGWLEIEGSERFVGFVLGLLRQLEANPEDVRLVMGFSS